MAIPLTDEKLNELSRMYNDSTVSEAESILSDVSTHLDAYDYIDLATMSEDMYDREFKALFEGGSTDIDMPAKWSTYAGGKNRPIRILRSDGSFFVVRGIIDSNTLTKKDPEKGCVKYSYVMNNIESEGAVNPMRGDNYRRAAFEGIANMLLSNSNAKPHILYDSKLADNIDTVNTNDVGEPDMEQDDDIFY